MERERIKEVTRRLDGSMSLRGKLKRSEARKTKCRVSSWSFLVEDLTGAYIGVSVLYLLCPGRQACGAERRPRENSCVTESKREIQRGRRGSERERDKEDVWQRDDFTESEKPHNIDILVSISPNGDTRACARVYPRHASTTKCV